jgi:hypothetical protein
MVHGARPALRPDPLPVAAASVRPGRLAKKRPSRALLYSAASARSVMHPAAASRRVRRARPLFGGAVAHRVAQQPEQGLGERLRSVEHLPGQAVGWTGDSASRKTTAPDHRIGSLAGVRPNALHSMTHGAQRGLPGRARGVGSECRTRDECLPSYTASDGIRPPLRPAHNGIGCHQRH